MTRVRRARTSTISQRSWLSSFANLAVGEAATGLLRLVALAVIARAVDPSAFGFLNVGLAVGGYLVVAHAGLEVVGTRAVAGRPSDSRPMTERIVSLRLVVAAAVYLAAATAAFVAPIEVLSQQLVLLYGLSLFTQALDVRWLFIGLERTRAVGVASAVSAAAYLVAVTVLVDGPGDVLWVPAAQIASEGLTSAILVAVSFRQIGPWSPRLTRRHWPSWRSSFVANLPIAASKAARGVSLGADIVLVGLLMSSDDVGQYGAARRLTLVALVFLGLYTHAFLPLVARAVQEGGSKSRDLVAVALVRTAAVVVPLAVVGTVWAVHFLRWFVGPQYGGAAPVLRILIWSIVLTCFGGLYAQVLLAFHRQRPLLVVDVVAAVVSISLMLALVPVLDLAGAALAALAGRAVTLVLSWAAARRFLRRGAGLAHLDLGSVTLAGPGG
ncbi:MAG: oligosaccharide flippase family protein [Anaerolineales bacterium]